MLFAVPHKCYVVLTCMLAFYKSVDSLLTLVRDWNFAREYSSPVSSKKYLHVRFQSHLLINTCDIAFGQYQCYTSMFFASIECLVDRLTLNCSNHNNVIVTWNDTPYGCVRSCTPTWNCTNGKDYKIKQVWRYCDYKCKSIAIFKV